MKFKHILMLTLGAAAVAAFPALTQAAPQQTGQGAIAQKADDAKAKTEAERKAERRAAAAAQKPKGDVAPREEEEEKPAR
ncbi:hypothetical protein [Xanthomonas fragariae]|uniref:hypothetical protein n=1 Tax=Xanthomonas fragariae TaxID=48664 RepID=UPI000D5537F3|nr:hypothetical protein [Xanthomonas fragariae]MDM7554897.1 hypothetical protein [Xanthomonas fragariae]MDM7558012.1 hypothetical protein [Xanthomonas fragariae]MDM7575704.1 hypothetical protein [Xanthomonas fragariae]MDM7578781.1 hypothetical protein [Xanthomonas fragariae]MDM7589010.1 hypothetical protein [Xanthomonas fragariae]